MPHFLFKNIWQPESSFLIHMLSCLIDGAGIVFNVTFHSLQQMSLLHFVVSSFSPGSK